MQRATDCVWISLFLMVSGGCVTERYNVVIRNVGSQPVDEAHVEYGTFRSIGGYLPPGRWKSHGDPEVPIPDRVVVAWRPEWGRLRRQEVEVRRHVPRGFRGDLVFEIDDEETVRLLVVPWNGEMISGGNKMRSRED